MASHKLRQSDALYQRLFHGIDITHFDVYTQSQERLGSILEVLFDQENRQCYLNIDSSSRVRNPLQLIPLKRFRVDEAHRRLYVEQVSGEVIPSVNREAIAPPAVGAAPIVSDRAPDIRSLQDSTPVETVSPVEFSAPLESEVPLEAPIVVVPGGMTTAHYAAAQHIPSVQSEYEATVLPEQEPIVQPEQPANFVRATPEVPELRPRAAAFRPNDEETIKLLEERVVVNRQRRKIGEVILRKEIETEMVQVPIRREKLIVEQVGAVNRQLASIYLDGQTQEASVASTARAHQATQLRSGQAGNATVNAEFSSIQEAIQFLQNYSGQLGDAEVQITLRRDRMM